MKHGSNYQRRAENTGGNGKKEKTFEITTMKINFMYTGARNLIWLSSGFNMF